MAKQLITDDQRKFLVKFADSEESLDLIEEKLLSLRRSFSIQRGLALTVASIGAVPLLIGYFRILLTSIAEDGSLHLHFAPINVFLFFVGIIIYASGFILLASTNRRYPTYVVFDSLVKCITKAKNAKGSQVMSDERKALSNRLISCSGAMRGYSPRVPVGLSNRIKAREARLMRLFVRNLVYPALVGTDEELSKIKEIAAKAALKVGVGNWIAVRTLHTDTKDYPTAESFQRWGSGVWNSMQRLLPLALPLIPVIIGGLIKYHADVFGWL